MGEREEILIDKEMHIIHSSNRKRALVIISSSDENRPAQRIPIRRKKAKLNKDMYILDINPRLGLKINSFILRHIYLQDIAVLKRDETYLLNYIFQDGIF
ncbi:hypothetical protein CDAR_540111 [Caerostris darwini]|uniref:Uncharacterized protein n=1 Tax=Caerostris darwini TaxID=1538125 RepID=A0AAV4WRF9_9ARAC|nr:hypothetical protein CDAR_540111 [Caerostris darwini]